MGKQSSCHPAHGLPGPATRGGLLLESMQCEAQSRLQGHLVLRHVHGDPGEEGRGVVKDKNSPYMYRVAVTRGSPRVRFLLKKEPYPNTLPFSTVSPYCTLLHCVPILYPSPLCPHTVPFSTVSPYCTLLHCVPILYPSPLILYPLHGVELALVQTCASGLSHWLVLDGS